MGSSYPTSRVVCAISHDEFVRFLAQISCLVPSEPPQEAVYIYRQSGLRGKHRSMRFASTDYQASESSPVRLTRSRTGFSNVQHCEHFRSALGYIVRRAIFHFLGPLSKVSECAILARGLGTGFLLLSINRLFWDVSLVNTLCFLPFTSPLGKWP